ncbi:helix-turn-helix transcriptional regulator [Variovorax sp. tm]|uniref:helix-turn-helix transcriptional regulator n=1 Tax=Variovorax atrisoli TaxID=3394203 RepID=UPI003A7F6650
MSRTASFEILDLYQTAQVASLDDFATWALKKLKRFVLFDSCADVVVHMGARREMVITGLVSLDVMPDKVALRKEYFGPETFDAYSKMSSPDPLLRKCLENPGHAHAMAVQDGASHPHVVEYSRRTESLNALVLIRPKPDNGFTSFNLWRASAKRRFTRRDVAHADLFIPHVQQALAINRKLASSALIGNSQQVGTVIAERNGLIHHLDDFALLLLRREYPDWLSGSLPREINARLLGDHALPHGGRFVGRHIILSLRRQGALMVISIHPKAQGERLTPAELRVVEQMVRHGTYKDAANALHVSPSTIRNQLHAIYGKLGIKGKSELMKVLPER